MKKKTILIALIVVIALGGFAITAKNNGKNKMIKVKTAVVQRGDINSYVSTTAIVEASEVKNYYGLQAKVLELNYKVGDKVKTGDILAVFDVQDLSTTLSQAQLQYNNAVLSRNDLYNQNTTLKNKIAAINKSITDYEGQIVELQLSNSQNAAAQIEAIQSAITTLKAQRDAITTISNEKLKQADNAVSLAKLSLNDAKSKASVYKNNIVADMDGIVTSVNIEVGAMGSVAQPAIVVQNLSSLKLHATLGKFDADKVKAGEEVKITNEGTVYGGKVTAVDPVATKGTLASSEPTIGVDIDVIDAKTNLKINFDADIDILVGQASSVIQVPAEALRTEKGNVNYVYVLDSKNIVHQKKVTLGIQSDNYIQITSGVSIDDTIILNPSSSIADGVSAVSY